MQIILPMHMPYYEQILHNGFVILLLLILFYALFMVTVYFGLDAYDYHYTNTTKRQILNYVICSIAIIGIIFIGIGFYHANTDYNPRSTTAYRTSNAKCNVNWVRDENLYSIHYHNNSIHYYSNDSLVLNGTNVKLAKTYWSTKQQKIVPLNPSGKAWMIVAKKLESQPKPHANLTMDVHLSYTKGSIETPMGTKKFVCYVNNHKPNTNSTYTTLDYH